MNVTITYDDTLYQLVPREPTPEMLHIGSGYFRTAGNTKGIASARACWSAMLSPAPTPPAEIGASPEVMDVLFDGYSVYQRVKQNGKDRRTSPENVSDVLDAIAAMIYQTKP